MDSQEITAQLDPLGGKGPPENLGVQDRGGNKERWVQSESLEIQGGKASQAFLVKMVPRERKDALGMLAPRVPLEKAGLQDKMGTRDQWVLLDALVGGASMADLDHLAFLVRQESLAHWERRERQETKVTLEPLGLPAEMASMAMTGNLVRWVNRAPSDPQGALVPRGSQGPSEGRAPRGSEGQLEVGIKEIAEIWERRERKGCLATLVMLGVLEKMDWTEKRAPQDPPESLGVWE